MAKITTHRKKMSKDEAYDLGFHMGVRKTLEYLTNYGILDSEIVALALEQKYLKEIKKLGDEAETK